jgi:hypothetical protein
MKKQTALEWLIQWAKENPVAFQSDYYAAIEQAKAMERDQIIEAYREGRTDQRSTIYKWYDRTSAEYYNQTYK